MYNFSELHEVVEQTPQVQEIVQELVRDRALRRHHRERIKNNRKGYWNVNGTKHPRSIGRMIKTPCLCSCWMCRSPRKLYGNSQQAFKISEIRKMKDERPDLISNDEYDGFAGFGEGITAIVEII